MTKPNDTDQINDPRLKRLYLRWVMGKNRGKSYLSEEEEQELQEAGLIGGGDNSKKLDVEKVKTTVAIVKGLMGEVEFQRKKWYEDEVWETMTKEQKKRAEKELFEKIYGASPKDYGFVVYKSLVGE